jgi:hypothetical protein
MTSFVDTQTGERELERAAEAAFLSRDRIAIGRHFSLIAVKKPP